MSISASGRSRTCTAIAGGLQPLGLASAQPTHVVSIPGRSRTCPATFGGSHAAATPREHACQWTAGESHPDFRHAETASSSWTSSPCNRPAGRRVNDGARTHLHRLHRPAAHCVAFIHHKGPRRASVPEAGFEPAVSCSRSRRDCPLRHSEIFSWGAGGRTPTSWLTARLATVTTHPSSEHPAGVEPAHPAWEAGRLPLHHRCLSPRPILFYGGARRS